MFYLHPDIVLLFGGVIAFLVLASSVGIWLQWRDRKEGRKSKVVENLVSRINSWWIMVLLIASAFIFGKHGVLILFFLVSMFALREFITLAPTRMADYYALVTAFYIVVPGQYLLIFSEWYGLYSIFIPVYIFLILPIIAAWGADNKNFLERAAKLQWGLMICVYAISHVPALLTLDIPGYEGREMLLIFYLVFVVQISDVFQYVVGKLFGQRKIAPKISPNKTIEGFVGGVFLASMMGAFLWSVTPFTFLQSLSFSVVINILGFCGGLVMSAIKRGQNIKDWGSMIGGHGGILDRLDSVCFAAPIFFHLVRYFWSA